MTKNYFLRTAAMFALFCGASAVSCSGNDDSTPGKKPGDDPSDKPAVVTYAKCESYGDYYDKGTNCFNLIIATCPVNASGEATGAGDIYQINLNSIQSDAENPIPANAVYNFDAQNSFAANTIAANTSKADVYASDLKKEVHVLKAGSLTVTKDGTSFKVEGSITLDNDKKIAISASNFTYENLAEEEPGGDGGVNYLAENLDLAPEYRAPVEFKGNAEGAGIYSITLAMSPEGPMITIFLMGPEATAETAAIPEGTFQVNDSFAINTAVSGSYDEAEDALMGSNYLDATNPDNIVLGLPVSGTVTVTKKGVTSDGKTGVYDVLMNTKTAENYTIKVTYAGDLPLDGETGGGDDEPLSTLTADHAIDFTGITEAEAEFYGDYYKTGAGNWSIYIEPTYGSTPKDGFCIELFTASTTSTTLPVGTFNCAKTGAANTYRPGDIVTQDGKNYVAYTYYLAASTAGIDAFGPAAEGPITITQSGSNYKFDINVVDDAGNKITGSWTGAVKVSDERKAAAPAKAPKFGKMVNKQMSQVFSMKENRPSVKSSLKASSAAKFEQSRK